MSILGEKCPNCGSMRFLVDAVLYAAPVRVYRRTATSRPSTQPVSVGYLDETPNDWTCYHATNVRCAECGRPWEEEDK